MTGKSKLTVLGTDIQELQIERITTNPQETVIDESKSQVSSILESDNLDIVKLKISSLIEKLDLELLTLDLLNKIYQKFINTDFNLKDYIESCLFEKVTKEICSGNIALLKQKKESIKNLLGIFSIDENDFIKEVFFNFYKQLTYNIKPNAENYKNNITNIQILVKNINSFYAFINLLDENNEKKNTKIFTTFSFSNKSISESKSKRFLISQKEYIVKYIIGFLYSDIANIYSDESEKIIEIVNYIIDSLAEINKLSEDLIDNEEIEKELGRINIDLLLKNCGEKSNILRKKLFEQLKKIKKIPESSKNPFNTAYRKNKLELQADDIINHMVFLTKEPYNELDTHGLTEKFNSLLYILENLKLKEISVEISVPEIKIGDNKINPENLNGSIHITQLKIGRNDITLNLIGLVNGINNIDFKIPNLIIQNINISDIISKIFNNLFISFEKDYTENIEKLDFAECKRLIDTTLVNIKELNDKLIKLGFGNFINQLQDDDFKKLHFISVLKEIFEDICYSYLSYEKDALSRDFQKLSGGVDPNKIDSITDDEILEDIKKIFKKIDLVILEKIKSGNIKSISEKKDNMDKNLFNSFPFYKNELFARTLEHLVENNDILLAENNELVDLNKVGDLLEQISGLINLSKDFGVGVDIDFGIDEVIKPLVNTSIESYGKWNITKIFEKISELIIFQIEKIDTDNNQKVKELQDYIKNYFILCDNTTLKYDVKVEAFQKNIKEACLKKDFEIKA